MNILFLYTSYIDPTKGGVQRVTRVLADFFESEGNSVFFLSLKKPNDVENIDQRQYFVPESKRFNTNANINFFGTFIANHNIDIVINQGGLGKDCSALANYSNKFGALEISVLHNSPLASIIHFSSSRKDIFKNFHIDFLLPVTDVKCIKQLILNLYRLKYQSHFRNLYEYSNRVVLLSNNFRNEFTFLVGRELDNKKITAISNPCSFQLKNDTIDVNKQNTVLYVGRIDFSQKRIDLLINIWNQLYKDYTDWNLEIVGEGPDLEKAKGIVKTLGCERISFEGRQDPEKYYRKASIFCMTSSFEGFPLVLVEAQTYGVVPVAFNSFSSVTDVINNGETGFLVEPFNEESYVEILSDLMSNNNLLRSISKNCKESAKRFELGDIGNQWLEMFVHLRS